MAEPIETESRLVTARGREMVENGQKVTKKKITILLKIEKRKKHLKCPSTGQ